MKTKMTTTTVSMVCTGNQTDSSKLVSLLALAAGAVAMPQTSNADIIYTDLNSSPAHVGFLGGEASFMFTLPGSALFGFQRFERTVTTTTPFTTTKLYRTVLAADMYGAAPAKIQAGAGGFAAPQTFGAAWDQGLPLTYTVGMGVANTYGHSPQNGYDHKYLAWTFVDSSAGGAVRYGWIEVGLSISNVNPIGSTGGPDVTIYGYAYDDTGAKPTMGQRPVPEPTSAAFMIVGALALGSRGLRNWRRNRETVGKS